MTPHKTNPKLKALSHRIKTNKLSVPSKKPPRKQLRETLWKGPQEDGITFSLLCKFLECKERFRLQVIEGLKEDEGFRHALEYGSLWHECEEAHSGGKPWEPALKEYRRKLILQYPDAEAQINKWSAVCKTQFPIYIDYWKGHPDEESRKPILEEVAFKVPYTLPSGRIVLLRGKWDCVLLLPLTKQDLQRSPDLRALAKQHGLKIGDYVIYLQENKTKGEIDELGILQAVAGNLQTLNYQIALRTLASPGSHDISFMGDKGAALAHALIKHPIAGTLYNVVRRPLSDHYSIKQKKTESATQFYERLGQTIRDNAFDPKGRPLNNTRWFMRWKAELNDNDISKFQLHTFNPLLEHLCDWWEWVKVDPFDPWRPRSLADHPSRGEYSSTDTWMSPHWQSPWGVYNSLASGWRGSYFEYLTRGREYTLTRITTLFPELESHDPKKPPQKRS